MRNLAKLLAVATVVALGCGAPCRSDGVCGVTGRGADTEVCDGDHWRTCGVDDGNHGLRIACLTSPKIAVCTPAGWSFEDAPSP